MSRLHHCIVVYLYTCHSIYHKISHMTTPDFAIFLSRLSFQSSVRPFVRLSIHVRPPVYPSLCLSVYPSVCLYIPLSVYPSARHNGACFLYAVVMINNSRAMLCDHQQTHSQRGTWINAPRHEPQENLCTLVCNLRD